MARDDLQERGGREKREGGVVDGEEREEGKGSIVGKRRDLTGGEILKAIVCSS